MKLLHITQSLQSVAGGLATAAKELHLALIRIGADSSLVGFGDSSHRNDVGNGTFLLRPTLARRWFYSRELEPLVRQNVIDADSVHAHGLWLYPNFVAGRQARLANRPLVIHPHGMLEPWALRRSRCKKGLARLLFENRNFRTAALWRALSSREADQIRAVAPRARVCVVPNGVAAPSTQVSAPRIHLEERFPELKNKQWLLFLSRINAKKGLDVLLSAWRNLPGPDWHLVIAGPDDGYGAALGKLIAEYRLTSRTTVTGMLAGRIKDAALQNCAALVLPSYSEGFSMAVLEAMSAARPVIITPGCNFSEVQELDCGYIVAPESTALANGLSEIMTASEAERRRLGENGRALVLRKYQWSAVAAQLLAELQML